MSRLELALQEVGLLDIVKEQCALTGQSIVELLRSRLSIDYGRVDTQCKVSAEDIILRMERDTGFKNQVLYDPTIGTVDFTPEEVRDLCRD